MVVPVPRVCIWTFQLAFFLSFLSFFFSCLCRLNLNHHKSVDLKSDHQGVLGCAEEVHGVYQTIVDDDDETKDKKGCILNQIIFQL